MPDKTAEAWRNGWFHTGDAFRRDEQGRYFFVDRIKDALRRRGENISSFEVEGLVNAHAGVLESAAIPVPSEWGEDEIKVCVVRNDVTLTEEQLVRDLIETMPRFMVPRYVEFADSLPKTEATQRVKKNLLRDDPLNDRTWDREAAGVAVPR
jgi:crotonobetaine/carnitine-CoA ligase